MASNSLRLYLIHPNHSTLPSSASTAIVSPAERTAPLFIPMTVDDPVLLDGVLADKPAGRCFLCRLLLLVISPPGNHRSPGFPAIAPGVFGIFIPRPGYLKTQPDGRVDSAIIAGRRRRNSARL